MRGIRWFVLLAAACAAPETQDPTDSTDTTDTTDAEDGSDRQATTDGGPWQVTWAPTPDPIPFDETFSLRIDVTTDAGAAIDPDAITLSVDATMPAHGHGMTTDPEVVVEGDHFLATGMLFHMTGRWQLKIAVEDSAGTVGRAAFNVRCCDTE